VAVVPESLRPPAAAPPVAAAEWARVRASTVATTGHWVFVGAIGRDGYPQVWAPPAPGEAATSVRVSRWMWAAHHGPIPDGQVCRHRCDLTVCVAPADLLLGTRSENSRDAARRDRITHAGRVGKADRRGPAATARAVREAVLAALGRGVVDAAALAAVVDAELAEGDPFADQLPLF
jgi:hypothetical protein